MLPLLDGFKTLCVGLSFVIASCNEQRVSNAYYNTIGPGAWL